MPSLWRQEIFEYRRTLFSILIVAVSTSQYMSYEYRQILKVHGLASSVGRTGVCWDNALAESFNASLKNEMVNRTHFPTKIQASDAIARYIEFYYNRQRIHSALGYKTPFEVLSGRTNHALAA